MTIVEKIKDKIAGPIVQHQRPQGIEAYWCLPTMVIKPDRHEKPDRQLMQLAIAASRAAAREVDFSDLASRPNCKPWLTIWPGEHYQLLSGLVQVLRPKVVVEIGTAEGLSALAMKKYMPEDGKVVTFDIVPWNQISDTILTPEDFADGKLEQRLGDLGDDRVFEANRDILEQADFLFSDGPKDNQFEWKLLEHLKTLKFRKPPIVMFDDTRLWSMLKFWRDLPYPKLDLTSFGHSSGSGLMRLEE